MADFISVKFVWCNCNFYIVTTFVTDNQQATFDTEYETIFQICIRKFYIVYLYRFVDNLLKPQANLCIF